MEEEIEKSGKGNGVEKKREEGEKGCAGKEREEGNFPTFLCEDADSSFSYLRFTFFPPMKEVKNLTKISLPPHGSSTPTRQQEEGKKFNLAD